MVVKFCLTLPGDSLEIGDKLDAAELVRLLRLLDGALIEAGKAAHWPLKFERRQNAVL